MTDPDAEWLAQIRKALPDDVARDIVGVFQAWALLEAMLTTWLVILMDVDDDVGRMVVERFDTRAKISRIKEIYDHFKNESSAKTVKELSSNYEKWVEIRNVLAHKVCFGMSEDGTHLMYATGRYARRQRDAMAQIGIDIRDLKRCALFAAKTAGQIEQQLPRQPPLV